jgi:hypothetical protein
MQVELRHLHEEAEKFGLSTALPAVAQALEEG